MRVEILYFTGCSNYAPAVRHVQEALRAESVAANVVEVEVEDAGTANAVNFLGSPTIRINGQDIEPSARSAQAFGLMCRTYVADGRRTGVPPVEWIRAAIREAMNACETLI